MLPFSERLEEFADELIASSLSLTVFAPRLAFLQARQNHQSGACSTHHPHPAHTSSEAGGYPQRHLFVQTVEVRKGAQHTLAAAVALHKELHCPLNAVF